MTVLCGTRGIEPQVTLASTLLFHTIHLLTVALVTAVYAAAMSPAGATRLASLSGWWAAALAAPVILFLLRPRAALSLANALLVRFGRAPLRSEVSTGALLRLFAVCLGSWLAVCAGFTALIRALGLRGDAGFAETLAQVGTAYPVAYAIGFLSFVTPGGLAIREGVLVLLLTPTFGRGPSLVVALAMRAWELMLEAVIGGSVVGFGRMTRTKPERALTTHGDREG
jgi:hypothetical protein